MALNVSIKKMVQWKNGRTSVIYYIEDDNTGEVKESLPPGGILNSGIDPVTYGDDNAEMLFNSGIALDEDAENTFAKQKLSEGAKTSKRSWKTIKEFNDALEKRLNNKTLNLQTAYSEWRLIYESLNPNIKNQITGYTSAFTASFDFTEPIPITDGYRKEFNQHIRNYLIYITNRALI